ncbi:Nephrin-like 17, partial [Homarus americanus]
MREQAGNYSVSALTDRGVINASFAVNVQYGPEKVLTGDRVKVEEGDRVSTKCSAAGNPVPHLTWTKNPIHSPNSSGVALGVGVGVARLVIESATRSDTGVYFCHAHNVVASAPPAKTYVVVEQAVTAADDINESENSWAAVGESGRLLCRVRAAPPPTFVWRNQGGLNLLNSDKYTIHEPELVDDLVVWSSVLEIKDVEPQDYATYRCTANNQLGTQNLLFTLNPPARPHPPINFTVSKVAGGEVWLSWTPNLDGGAPSGYTLKYRPSGSLVYQYMEVPGGGTSTARVTGLTPATEYTVAIQARNHHGRSHFVSRSIVTLLARSGDSTIMQDVADTSGKLPVGSGNPRTEDDSNSTEEGGSRVPRLILLIMTLTGAALLALNISIIACFVRRRAMNRNPSMTLSSKSSALGSCAATPAATPALNSNHHLPLTTMSTNSFTSPPTGYQEEEQTRLEESELRTLATADDSITANPHAIPYHNGGIITTKSTYLVLNNTTPKTSQAATAGPSQRWISEDSSSSSASAASSQGGEISQCQHDLVNFLNEPDVCSMASSFYDNSLQEDPQRRGSDTYPADDQFSLCSNRSNNSRVYSQGFLRPLSSLGSLQQQTTPQLIQDTLHALPRSSQTHQRLRQQNSLEYSSLNPSGLYNLRTDNIDPKRSLLSFTSGMDTISPSLYLIHTGDICL